MARKDRSSSRRPERRPSGGKDPRGQGDRDRARPPRRDEPPRRHENVTARRDGGAPIVYGRNPVREALRGRRRVHRIWSSDDGWSGAPVTRATNEEIEARCGSDAHQGVCAEVDPYPYADADAFLAVENPLIVALDEVTDPQNLGAVARTAEAVGATGIVIPERRAAEVTGAVCKASAGAVEHLQIARIRNLADFLAQAKEAGAWCYGAAAGAATPYTAPDYRGGVVLVLGAEGKGLRPRVAAACDDLVGLPLLGRIESLNVSATAAVLLYAILQFRLDTST